VNPPYPAGPHPPLRPLAPPAVVREVGLRDGLQSIARVLPTAQKIEWMNAAYAAGQREIEVGSFVPARLLPQLADTAEVLAHAKTLPGLRASVLVPNLRGAERAWNAARPDGAAAVGQPRPQPGQPAQDARRGGGRGGPHPRRARRGRLAPPLIEGGVGTAFGCTMQGEVAESEVLRLMQALLDAGCRPREPGRHRGLRRPGRGAAPVRARPAPWRATALACGHFHDTRGMGLANVYAAWQTGVTRFDACLAGIGGCPHAPGASGNVTTEDLAYMLRAWASTPAST
jgi:hydroxymethylglutaryl-CoA lyase